MIYHLGESMSAATPTLMRRLQEELRAETAIVISYKTLAQAILHVMGSKGVLRLQAFHLRDFLRQDEHQDLINRIARWGTRIYGNVAIERYVYPVYVMRSRELGFVPISSKQFRARSLQSWEEFTGKDHQRNQEYKIRRLAKVGRVVTVCETNHA